MIQLSQRAQVGVAITLVAFLILTRSQHFASLHSLPSASWAVYFLAGVYLRPVWALPVLLALTWVLDFLSFTSGGSSFCFTPAYVFLLPAYSALWLGGRWYSGRHRFAAITLLPLLGAGALSAGTAELLSSGGFYWFSGHFTQPTVAEFAARVLEYFPPMLAGLFFYVGIAGLVHVAVGAVSTPSEYGGKAG